MTDRYHFLPLLSLALVLSCLTTASGGTPKQSKHEAYALEMLWWPEYCHHNPQLKYCGGSSFRGFVLGAFIPLSEQGQAHKCETQTENFRPDNKLLQVMPDEKLLEAQWSLYGACSGLSQTAYFDHLSRIYRSVHIPKEFISPTEHFEVGVSQIEEEFLQKKVPLSPSALYVFCRSGFLSKIQIVRGAHTVKPVETCDVQRLKVIARMPLAE